MAAKHGFFRPHLGRGFPQVASTTMREGGGVLSLADELFGTTANGIAIEFRDDSYAMRSAGVATRGIATDLLTFARSGIKTRFNSAGLMVDVTDGVAAFDHDASAQDVDEPALKKRLGASVEGAATQRLTYTEDFSNAAWTKGGCSISSNAVAAPDGTTTMDKIVEDSSTGDHRVFQAISTTTGEELVLSFFAMQGERTLVQSYLAGGAGQATFNIAAGTLTVSSGAGVMQNCGAHPVTGNTIWRCTTAAPSPVTSTNNQQIRLVNTGTTTSYTGDGSSGLYVWGANVHTGLNTTSYIKRVSAAASRSADSLTLPVASISPWSTTQGAVEVSGRAPYGNGLAVLWQVDDGSEDNRLRIERDATGDLHCIVTAGGVAQADLDLGAVAKGADFSVAFAWGADDFAASLDGAAAVTDASGTVPTGLTTMRFGQSFTGEHWNSAIRSVLYDVP